MEHFTSNNLRSIGLARESNESGKAFLFTFYL